MTGIKSVHGNEWDAGHNLIVYPELVDQADVVLIQREFPRFQQSYEEIITRARQAGIPVVYDLDDLLIALPEDHPEARHYEHARVQILRAAMEADAVTCSTEGIRQALAPFNSNIRVFPNTIIDNLWPQPAVQTAENTPLVIGYMASHSHAADLEMIAPILEKILDRYQHSVVLRCWGVEPPQSLLQRPNVHFVDMNIWSYAEFCAYFASQHIDLGISPLRQNWFNECKSAIKYLEYSYLGIPAVYSRVGPYKDMVHDGQNGFLAENFAEWEQRLTEMIGQPDLRARLGAAARQDVLKSHLLSKRAAQWFDFYTQIKPSDRKTYPVDSVSEFMHLAAQWHQDLEERLSAQIELLRQQKELTQQAWGHANAPDRLNPQAALAPQPKALGRHFLPENSAQRRLFNSTRNGLALFRRDGFHAFWRRLKEKTRPSAASYGSGISAPIQIELQSRVDPSPGCRQPAVSIVALWASGMPELDLEALEVWAGRQTWQPVELILWDRENQRAKPVDQIGEDWPAGDFSMLTRGLKGSFIVLYGPNLLVQDPTYLEINLAALLSEDLLFTLNLLPGDAENLDWIRKGKAAGSTLDPFTRLVMRKDILLKDGSLALQPDKPAPIGRIIFHAAGSPSPQTFSAVEETIDNKWVVLNRRIFWLENDAPAPLHIECLLHPIDQIFPVHPDQAQLPTVLIASQFFAMGGAESILLNLMLALSGKVRFVVVSLEPQDASLGSTEGDFRQLTPYVYTLAETIDPMLNASFIDHLVSRFAPICFYIANGTGWLYDMLPEFRQSHPQISIVNQVYDHQLGWINHYRPELVAAIDSHIASNNSIHRAYEKRKVNSADIFDIVNGVDPVEYRPERYAPDERAAIRERLGIPRGVRVVTFMGRLHPQKRPLDFVELVRRFEEDPSIFFLMVGNGPLKVRVLATAAKTGLKKFKQMDFYRPSWDIFSFSDLLVLPSEYEGMPMVVLEALSSGVPVVATRVGNIEQILQVTHGGQVVAHIGDIDALAQAIRQVLAGSWEAEPVRQAVIEHYSIEKMAEKYLAVFLRTKHA